LGGDGVKCVNHWFLVEDEARISTKWGVKVTLLYKCKRCGFRPKGVVVNPPEHGVDVEVTA
jgi:hypothetical protein